MHLHRRQPAELLLRTHGAHVHPRVEMTLHFSTLPNEQLPISLGSSSIIS